MGLSVSIILLPLFVLAQAPPPPPLTPAQQAAAAQQLAATQAAQISNGIGTSSASGAAPQNSNQISIFEASLDNFINTQKAREISNSMGQQLENEAGTVYSSCSPANAATDPDCYLSSTLLGMSAITGQSSTSFNQAQEVAWRDVCSFSSIAACTDNPPDIFGGVLVTPPAFTPEEIAKINEELITRGFIVNPRTGVVQVPGSKVINPANPESLKKNLGETEAKNLLEKIKAMEKAALKKIAGISKKDVIKKLGIHQGQKPMARASTFTDQSTPSLGFRAPNSMYEEPRQEEQALGMSTSFRGEPVGVAKDSIFRMIQFRYQVKANQRTFLTIP